MKTNAYVLKGKYINYQRLIMIWEKRSISPKYVRLCKEEGKNVLLINKILRDPKAHTSFTQENALEKTQSL